MIIGLISGNLEIEERKRLWAQATLGSPIFMKAVIMFI
jgi:hypothetical protein